MCDMLLTGPQGVVKLETIDAQTGGAVGQNAVENNLYLTSEALKKDEQTALKIYSVIKEQVKHECGSKGRIAECRQNVGRIIKFIQDKRFDSRFKDLKKESIGYLNQHPDWVADYLKAEYEKLDTEDKSILHRYVKPGAEIVSGSLGVVLSSVTGGGSCAETFGLGCAAALVGITSSYDHVITGAKNFGKKASEQRPTITVQALKQLGLSDQAAEYVQLSIDSFSVGKSGARMPTAKPVSDAKPRWEVDRKLNKLTTREQVEKNVQEIRNGNKNSNFSQHAQLEREIKKLRTSEGKANSASAALLTLDLKTAQAANQVVESLRSTGNLPSNYITKSQAISMGWRPGKALGNTIKNGQLGGDIFANSTNILPAKQGRIWYEADIGLINTMSRSNQAGTRLLYSNDGLLYITTDHYISAIQIGTWK